VRGPQLPVPLSCHLKTVSVNFTHVVSASTRSAPKAF
jgi:hypothetical protein